MNHVREQIAEVMKVRYKELLEPLIPALQKKATELFLEGRDREALNTRSLLRAVQHRVLELTIPETPDAFTAWLQEKQDSFPIKRQRESPWPLVHVRVQGGSTGVAQVRPHHKHGYATLVLLDDNGNPREDLQGQPVKEGTLYAGGKPVVFHPRRRSL